MKLSNITFAAYLAGTTMAKKEETTPSALRQRSVEVEVENEDPSIADIVNGDVVPKSFKPGYLVSLGSLGDIGEANTWPLLFMHKCGGSLISPSLVLTSASCVSKGNVALIDYVDFNLYDRSDRAGTITMRPRKDDYFIQMHPEYNPTSFNMDFALIVLDEPINNIDPAKINGDANLPSSGDDKIWTAGWGVTDALPSYIETTYLEDCVNNYGAGGITANMLCTQGEVVDGVAKAFCDGDSGNPLIKNTNQGPILVGVASFSGEALCGKSDVPDVYARVSAAYDWINCWMEKTEPKKRRSKACKETMGLKEVFV